MLASVATQRVSLSLKSLTLSPLLLGCCHFYSLGAPIPPFMLSLLLLCCCSFTNVAAPPSMLPLHLDVAIPPSILTLHQCCHSFFHGLMFLLLPDITAPPLLLLLFLECCLNLQCPGKNELFSIADLPTGHLTRGKPYPKVFDLFAPPLMLSLLLWCCQSSTTRSPTRLLLWCCCSFFYVAVPPFMLPLHLDVAIPPLILTFFL